MNLLNYVKVIIMAALPVAELRGAIPLAILVYKMPWTVAYILSIIGNLLPVVPLLLFLGPVSEFLRRWKIFDIFFNWLFKRTRRKEKSFQKYGPFALMLFVAIPLPVTGAWTGCAAAFLFGIPFFRAFTMIAFGVMFAGVIVTLATTGTLEFLKIFVKLPT